MGDRGWLFPVRCDGLQGRILLGSVEDTLRQSVQMILTTKRGERFLHPDFGCDAYKFLFRGTDYTTLSQIENEITAAIRRGETRIHELEVCALPDQDNLGGVRVSISYTIPGLSARIQQNHTYSIT